MDPTPKSMFLDLFVSGCHGYSFSAVSQHRRKSASRAVTLASCPTNKYRCMFTFLRCYMERKQFLHETARNMVCGSSWVTGSQFLQRDIAVNFLSKLFVGCFELQKWSSVSSHYIGEKADVSTSLWFRGELSLFFLKSRLKYIHTLIQAENKGRFCFIFKSCTSEPVNSLNKAFTKILSLLVSGHFRQFVMNSESFLQQEYS